MSKQITKNLRKIIVVSMLVFAVIVLWKGCASSETTYGQVEIGETFNHNRDGYYMKLPQGYCLAVDLGEKTRLIGISDEQENIAFGGDGEHEAVYNNPQTMSAHYIKGYYNDNYLVLCEELEDESLVYWSFCFDDKKITRYDTAQEVFSLYNFDSKDWFTLCNTYDQIID